MNRLITKSLALVALVGAFTVFSAAKSEAALTAYICNDAACLGGDDLIVADNGAGDSFPFNTVDGVISTGTLNIGDYSIATNVSKSKPSQLNGMDLSWTATRNNPATGNGDLWFYAIDDNFLGTPSLLAH